MTRFDKLYAQTHPKVTNTEKPIIKDSAVEDFEDVEDVEAEDVEAGENLQEGEEVDGADSDID